MLTTPCVICRAKAHIVSIHKPRAAERAITWQCSRDACGHRWIATLTAARINTAHNTSADLAEAPAQPPGSSAPSRASQRRKRRLLAKHKGKMPSAAQ